MIFKSKLFSATWDTWMYYHNGTYYLYYLITQTGYGEGFGVASSADGVHFTDHGAAILASENMQIYLGTGAIWKASDFETSGTFICNYSEWRKHLDGVRQNILFATSKDLIHWEKCGDIFMFSPDGDLYKEYRSVWARWDTINTIDRPEGGYYGFFTAVPKDRRIGFGLGESIDGLSWAALPPPEVALGPFSEVKKTEVATVCEHAGRIYLLIGGVVHRYGVGVYTADNVFGPYVPAEINFGIFSNAHFEHAYYTRFFHAGDSLLCNHHAILRQQNDYGRPITYLAPIKRVAFDEAGILRLMWWEGNQAAKGAEKQAATGDCILEGIMGTGRQLTLMLEDGSETVIVVEKTGEVTYMLRENDTLQTDESYERGFAIASAPFIRLLTREGLTELYADDHFIGCYTPAAPVKEITHDLTDVRVWEWA